MPRTCNFCANEATRFFRSFGGHQKLSLVCVHHFEGMGFEYSLSRGKVYEVFPEVVHATSRSLSEDCPVDWASRGLLCGGRSGIVGPSARVTCLECMKIIDHPPRKTIWERLLSV